MIIIMVYLINFHYIVLFLICEIILSCVWMNTVTAFSSRQDQSFEAWVLMST